MTTEEINKAAEEYATKLDVSTFDYKAARKDFREGADCGCSSDDFLN